MLGKWRGIFRHKNKIFATYLIFALSTFSILQFNSQVEIMKGNYWIDQDKLYAQKDNLITPIKYKKRGKMMLFYIGGKLWGRYKKM